MITKLKVGVIKKDTVLETGQSFLDVPVDLIGVNEEGEEVIVETRKFGFPLTMTAAEIKEELGKVLSTTISDAENALKNQVNDQLNKQADETIEALQEQEIVVEPKVEEEAV